MATALIVAPARAQAPKDAQAEKALTAAMGTDYLETRFDQAEKKLRAAIAERAFKYSYDWQNDSKQGEVAPFPDPYTNAPSERDIFMSPVTPDEIGVVVGGGVAPQMGQCVSISSRSSAGKPMLTNKIQFPK